MNEILKISGYVDITKKVDHILEMPELGGFCNYCFNNHTCKSRFDIDFSCATLSLFFEHSLKEKIVKYAEKSFKYTLIRKFKNEPIFYLVLNVHEDGDFLILFLRLPNRV